MKRQRLYRQDFHRYSLKPRNRMRRPFSVLNQFDRLPYRLWDNWVETYSHRKSHEVTGGFDCCEQIGYGGIYICDRGQHSRMLTYTIAVNHSVQRSWLSF